MTAEHIWEILYIVGFTGATLSTMGNILTRKRLKRLMKSKSEHYKKIEMKLKSQMYMQNVINHSLAQLTKDIDLQQCYDAGYESVKNPNTSNCHYLFFMTKDRKESWEKGQRDARLAQK